jgi:PIN domain nuclease of toxin-antitoxin system
MVLDTHVWIGLVTGTPRLNPGFVESLQTRPEPLRISAISVREALLLLQAGRIRSKLSAPETVRQWLNAYDIVVVPIDIEIIFASGTLPFDHRDPADQIIAATAYQLGLPLATADGELRHLAWLSTVNPF